VNNTANAGFYNVTVVAETSDEIVQHAWNWTVTSSDGDSDSDVVSSSGGGGGGSGGTGEDYYNILKKEVKREYVNANSEISYEFEEETNAIDYIKFTSLKNSGTIAATIEVLKDTSSLVETKPSGEVYQNMNIWVGTAGFATTQNIANPVIGFKVERSWIEDNDIVVSSIRLCRCNNDVWDHLTTREIGDDEKYIYFGADTSGFSPFAIIGYTEEEMAAQDVDEPTLGLESTMMSPPSDIASEADMGDEVPATEADTIPGLGISALMLLIGCAYLTMKGVKHP
jgi:PGF-pre-PGF domain-containing protein